MDLELTDGRDGGDDFTELELVQDRSLTGGVETDHQNSHLLLGEKPAEELRERQSHLFPLSHTKCQSNSAQGSQN